MQTTWGRTDGAIKTMKGMSVKVANKYSLPVYGGAVMFNMFLSYKNNRMNE